MPQKTLIVQFRVSSVEHQRLKSIAHARGCASVSALIRKATLEKDLWLERKVQEIYLIVTELKGKLDGS